jgi:hypothetical protein
VQNLHMHNFLVARRLGKVGTYSFLANSFPTRRAPGLHFEPLGKMRLWGVGDLLIT